MILLKNDVSLLISVENNSEIPWTHTFQAKWNEQASNKTTHVPKIYNQMCVQLSQPEIWVPAARTIFKAQLEFQLRSQSEQPSSEPHSSKTKHMMLPLNSLTFCKMILVLRCPFVQWLTNTSSQTNIKYKFT